MVHPRLYEIPLLFDKIIALLAGIGIFPISQGSAQRRTIPQTEASTVTISGGPSEFRKPHV